VEICCGKTSGGLITRVNTQANGTVRGAVDRNILTASNVSGNWGGKKSHEWRHLGVLIAHNTRKKTGGGGNRGGKRKSHVIFRSNAPKAKQGE